MAENSVRAHIFSRRKRGDREEAKISLFNPDGTPFILGGKPTPSADTYSAEEIGFISLSFPLDGGMHKSTMGGFVTRMKVPAGKPINKVWLPVETPSLVAGFNAFGIFDDDGTFVEQTNSDPNLFTVSGWRGLSVLSQIPAQDEDRFVHVYSCVANTSALVLFSSPQDVGNIPKFFNGIRADHRRTWFLPSNGSMPSILDVANGGTNVSYLLLVALS